MDLLPDSFFPESRYSADDHDTFLSRRLVDFPWVKIELHKFIGADLAECFHTHPAWAIRIGIRGGYIEKLESGELKAFRAGDIGIVRPTTSHLVQYLLYSRPAYTLWIRGPKVASIEIRGAGAPEHGFRRERS